MNESALSQLSYESITFCQIEAVLSRPYRLTKKLCSQCKCCTTPAAAVGVRIGYRERRFRERRLDGSHGHRSDRLVFRDPGRVGVELWHVNHACVLFP